MDNRRMLTSRPADLERPKPRSRAWMNERARRIEIETEAEMLHFVTETVTDWQIERDQCLARARELDAATARLIEVWAG